MKNIVVAAKKNEDRWGGALIVSGILQQVSEDMNVPEFTGVALEAALEKAHQVTITIMIDQDQQ